VNDIDLTDSRAEDVQPQGFVPSHLALPALRDRSNRDTALEYAAVELGEVRVMAALLDGPIAEGIGVSATRLQRLLRALAAGTLAAVALTVGLAAGPGSSSAEAAEAPQPDPAAAVSVGVRTVPVVLSSAVVTARIPVTTTHVTPAGYHCAAVFSARLGFVGRACSLLPSFTVAVRLDARAVPVGRSTLTVVDDVAPFDGLPATVTLVARRPSRFGTGTWTPTYGATALTVTAPLLMYSPAAGAVAAAATSPVQVQELRAGRWVTVATLTTNRYGDRHGHP
jgi:hypothetical protein